MRTPPTITVGAAQVTFAGRVRSCRRPPPAKKAWQTLVADMQRAKHIADLFAGFGPFALRLAAKSRIAASTAMPAR